MQVFQFVLGLPLTVFLVQGQSLIDRARQLEDRGEAAQAELVLRQAAAGANAEATVLETYAEFLDRHGAPRARSAYEKFLEAARRLPDDNLMRLAAMRRLVLLALEAGDRPAASRYLAQYHAAGGKDWAHVSLDESPAPAESRETIEIPGPFNSFKRMAAISQDVTEDGLVLALSRNVVLNGYHAGSGKESLEPSEYLKLLTRYLSQARELDKLAGPEKKIRVETCDSPQAGDLLRTLGYRMRGGCGSEVVLETVNASRAFLTIDSGFPLAELEQSLRTNRPFLYDYRPTRVPILWSAAYWLGSKERPAGELIDGLLADPSLSRFYLGMSKPDPVTAEELRKNVPAARLKAFAHVLDFFGSMFQIREGKAMVPGGTRSERAWEDLVGASPNQGAHFFERLISRDDGWLASFFDALARMEGPARDYLLEPARMRRFYLAIRGRVTSPGPARPVFQANTDMLLLTAHLWLDRDGRPHIPGGIEVWKNLFINLPRGKRDVRLTRAASAWKEPDDVLEALFALCRKAIDNQPLKIFMATNDLDRNRTRPLEAATVDRLAKEYSRYGAQYSIFTEVPSVSDKTLLQFFDTAAMVDRIGKQELRADTTGILQALVGLWQILCRQGAIRSSEADGSLSGILSGFGAVRNAREVFDSGRSGVGLLLKSAGAQQGVGPQDRLVDLLTVDGTRAEPELRDAITAGMLGYFEAQRLVSLNLLFGLADNLEGLVRGEKLNTALVGRLASRISEIESPRSSLTTAEKNALASGYWADHHIASERRLNLRALIERAGSDPEKLSEVRGSLTPLLRDTLVGLNYIYYAPPGAQLLRASPSFVRSHDFIGTPGSNGPWEATEPHGAGWPSNAGGRLDGSLSGLPYALAEAEQNFLIPDREQALIWGDLVPQMIVSATVPRWWSVSAAEMHWVALHLRYASSLLAEAALDPELRTQVLEMLARQAGPARVYQVSRLLERGDVVEALAQVTPSERFEIARRMLALRPDAGSVLAARIRQLSEGPSHVNYAAVSRAFGTPKPTLRGSYQPELLHLRTFPTLMGYSSRLLAESWESNTLFWAELADGLYLPPAQLNLLIPQWTRETVERIFATHLEDWPAVLRSLRFVGDDVRLKAGQRASGEQQASLR